MNRPKGRSRKKRALARGKGSQIAYCDYLTYPETNKNVTEMEQVEEQKCGSIL